MKIQLAVSPKVLKGMPVTIVLTFPGLCGPGVLTYGGTKGDDGGEPQGMPESPSRPSRPMVGPPLDGGNSFPRVLRPGHLVAPP